MSAELEEGCHLQLDFGKLLKVAQTGAEVVPVVAQDAQTGEVLIVGYANQLALQTTLKERKATFWSTSRNELWIKGATSGDFLELVEVRVNCEQNSLLYLVRLAGAGSCHTKDASGKARHGCYYRRVNPDGSLSFVQETN
jgi:phosphoribosyl-AMP cyclohydrolase